MRKNTHHRTRNVILAPEDIRLFSDALAIAYPDARYHMVPTWEQRQRSRPPRLLAGPSLYRIWQAAQRFQANVCMHFETAWQPAWHRDSMTGHWVFWPPRNPYVIFGCLYGFLEPQPGITAIDPRGHIDVYCDPDWQEHYRFARRFFRLFGKFASDRNLVRVAYPSGEILESFIGRTAWQWVGHEARRWAAAADDRFLNFIVASKSGLRPVAEEMALHKTER